MKPLPHFCQCTRKSNIPEISSKQNNIRIIVVDEKVINYFLNSNLGVNIWIVIVVFVVGKIRAL
jgi:hypothetical protein